MIGETDYLNFAIEFRGFMPLTNPKEWGTLPTNQGIEYPAESDREDKRDMEELIRLLQEICIEHLVMRRLLREDKQISRVRELCRSKHYRDVVQTQFRETLGNNLGTLPDSIDTADLLAVLQTTNLGE